MALFNGIFLKKFLFASSAVGLSITPVVLITKHGSLMSGSYVSELKKNLKEVVGKYADKFGI